MSLQTWSETLITSQVDGPALTNSITATNLLPPAAIHTLPANTMSIGKKFRVRASGRISTVVTTPGTLTLDVRLGSVIVFNGGAMALNTVAKTNVSWNLDEILTCRSIGNGTVATMIGTGKWESEAVVGSPAPSAGGSGVLLLPASAPAVGTGFDSTVANTVNLFGTWSVANASNSILVHQYSFESMN